MKYQYQYQYIFLLVAFAWFFAACGGSPSTEQAVVARQQVVDGKDNVQAVAIPETEHNLDSLTMQELRILGSSIYARHGTLFNESDLRRYWRENTAWYDTLSRSKYIKTLAGGQDGAIALLPDEQAFVDKISRRMAQLQQANYLYSVYDTVANIMNIVNMFQYAEIKKQEIMDDLAVDNYAVVADTLPQLFQVYQRNDSLQIPNFVTVDLFVQLSHIYESYLIRTVEEKQFAPLLAEICMALYQASVEQANKATKEDIKDMAAYNAAFYAVAYNLLTGKQLKIPGDYQTAMEEELAYIAQQEDHRPALLDIKANFPYSAFKPYGHYTRTAGLRRYFKAWKWLQLAPYCTNDKTQLQQASFAAMLLQTARTKSGEPVIDLYSRLYGAIAWFTGQPSGSSILDMALLLKKERVTSVAAVLDAKMQAKLGAILEKTAPAEQPVRYATGCRDGVYFLPQPVYVDDEVLQAMADPTPDAGRAFPKALDVFAAFGSQPATDKLLSGNREDTLWAAYPAQLARMTDEVEHFKDWNASSYNKRLECLLAMQQNAQRSPQFMKKKTWNRKKLTTTSASWVKMKHDVLLYGVIPDHPEPLNAASATDSLPEPLTAGYVEPNLPFWIKMREWVELTGNTLQKYRLMTDTLNTYTDRMQRYIALMEDATRKELNNNRLTDEACRFIAHIGDSVRLFTLSMIEPHIDRWDWAAGPDRSVAVFEKVYQRNIPGCSKNGTLYAATGNVNNIYVIVEIGGYLYLTKGAVFSYDEFPMPPGKDLNDDDWRGMRGER